MLVAAWSTPARPEPAPSLIETHGIEIEVPAGWSVTNKGTSTAIMPTRYKGRGIQVTEAAAPTTKEFIVAVAKAAKIDHATVQEGERNGAKVVSASGTIAVKDKGNVDVDLVAVTNRANHTVILTSYIKSDSDPALRDANDKLLRSAHLAGPKMTLVVEKPKTSGLAGYPPEVITVLGKMATTLDGLFRFPRPLPIKVGECGVVNAFYSAADHAIIMCHEFWDDTLARFKREKLDDATVAKLTQGTVMFAFFHELGHALVGELGLPITGKGEDAADEVATIFLGQAKEFGRVAAVSGAAWFQSMAAAPNHRNVFYDEHSFDEQRVVSIACLLYGSNQQTYGAWLDSMKIPAKRKARCVRDYNDRLKAWNSLIEPHMRLPAKH